ncbi:hypothetical protein Acr_04g0008980 [Actinidia rufa]|uniref:Uncharacterized protein n=1 Tax=Actinidia rufa TaxID=165716 RepID=A0A7J0EIF6_9ERIC|nr:hypothetical protein Acr_04g0008980 [Actinidia rufa]
MGRRKTAKKTKELSVAIAESSSIGEESSPQKTPRKRGRPRKIVKRSESEEIKQEGEAEREARERESKKVKEEDSEEVKEEPATSIAKKEQTELPKVQASRSRARRKSKPQNSSSDF